MNTVQRPLRSDLNELHHAKINDLGDRHFVTSSKSMISGKTQAGKVSKTFI